MKIDLTRIPDLPDSAAAKATSKLVENGRTNTAVSKDTAKLSMGQAMIEALASQVNETPEIRFDKVVALAQQVRAGTYPVTADQTADAVIAHMILIPAA